MPKFVTMTKTHKRTAFVDAFSSLESFTTADIAAFFRKEEPEMKQTTINWRVYKMIQDAVIVRTSRGHFRIGNKKSFTPVLDKNLSTVAKQIRKQFPFVSFSVWDSAVLNSLAQHLSNKCFYIIEAEKDAVETIFHFLQEKKKVVYLNPTENIVENYVHSEIAKPFIVKNLISEAPTVPVNNIVTSSIEKILVDVYCDTNIFQAYQGNELHLIYTNAFSQYSINQGKLLRYASRRGKKEEIQNMILQINGNIY